LRALACVSEATLRVSKRQRYQRVSPRHAGCDGSSSMFTVVVAAVPSLLAVALFVATLKLRGCRPR